VAFAEDRALDANTSDGENIGTTQRGIGPCYRDKVGRAHAIRLGDLYRPNFRDRVFHVTAEKNRVLAAMTAPGRFEPLDAQAIYDQYQAFAGRLAPYVDDTTSYLLQACEEGKRILFEGAQGSLLDVDHGTYPFVTSSNSSGVGVPSGAGVPPSSLKRMVGVIKAYSTRVGGGPFPTEQDNEIGRRIREAGNEYGTVTRRPRRCGWLDGVALRYTARLSGVSAVCVMLLDVLSGLEEIRICTAYEIRGRRTDRFPSHVDDLRLAQPVYETLPGWRDDISQVRTVEDLPSNARDYLERISRLAGAPVEVVSVGPDRKQTMRLAKS
jgi:adenylosuccinate synthase